MSQYVTKIRTEAGDLQIDYEALANLPTTDTTLSVSGKAADAKSVADAINGMNSKFSNPNILINGDFQIWQRGQSFSNIANKYSADRWMIKNAKGNTSLVERSTDVPSNEFLRQSIHITETLTENTYLRYNFENALKGTFTLSFWYKTSVEFSPYIYDNSAFVHLGKLTTLNTWTKAIFTFTATSMTFINIIHAMSAGNCYIAGVKLEYGDIATVLMPRTGAEELALCQRYYEKRNVIFFPYTGVAPTTNYVAVNGGEHAVTKRAVPTTTMGTFLDRTNATVSVSTSKITQSIDGLRMIQTSASCDQYFLGVDVTFDAEIY